jgi:hypothetical protein
VISRNQITQEIVFTVDERDEIVQSLKEIFGTTEVGRDYKKNFYSAESADADLEKILSAAVLVAGGPNISVSSMTRGLQLLMDSGEISPKNPATSSELQEPEEDLRPRDRNGKPLTESQIAWKAMAEWTNTHSMQEVNARKRTDPQYAAFVRKAYDSEVTHEIPDAVVPAGEPTNSVKQTEALRRFVELYNRTPISALKPINGMITLDGDTVPYAEFQRLIVRATNAGLI